MTDTAVQQLADIREQWGDLLAAISRPPATEWPPRQPSHTLDVADAEPGPHVGRLPLTLRQHPAPLNLTALDAAMGIEHGLFDLADRLAAAHQSTTVGRDDPDRWHYAGLRHLDRRAPIATAGSRALGLHWAAVWIADRLAQTEPTDLHGVVRGVLRAHAERVTSEAHRLLLAALGRDERAIPASAPCPWCHGQLTTRTTSGDPDDMTITCGTGPSCTAPTVYDTNPASFTFGRRTWHGRDQIAALTIAILHAQETAA